ncbi:hypothetical protein C100_04760 [Sphingobium sp. C100]|nr:hypothetical protein C100_04760 [Sphingobium sp. C100]
MLMSVLLVRICEITYAFECETLWMWSGCSLSGSKQAIDLHFNANQFLMLRANFFDHFTVGKHCGS